METEADESATLLMESTLKKEPYLPLPVKQTLCFVQGSEKFEPDRSDEAVFSPPTAEKGATREKKKSFWKRVSGSPLCKVTVVVYLLGCVVVSALYVSLYGSSSQKMFAASDAWIPGKPTPPPKHPHPPPSAPPLRFLDAPYTEWMSQRWTYPSGDNFSDWPSLPPFLNPVLQITSGLLGDEQGVWFLTNTSLYFALNLDGADPDIVQFVDIGGELEVEVGPGSWVTVDLWGEVYLATPYNVSLLDCSQEPKYTCSIVAQLSEDTPLEWNEVTAAVVSVSDGTLWLGTDSGLYSIQRNFDSLTINNVTSVDGAITTLAWRSSLFTNDKHGNRRKSFLFHPPSSPQPEQYLVHTGSGGLHGTHGRPHREPPRRDTFGLLVAGTRERLYFFNGEMWWYEWVSMWSSGRGGTIDGVPTSLSFSLTGDLFVGNNVSLTRVNTNYTFHRFGPLQGLPYNQILSLHHSPYTPQYPPPLLRTRPPSDEGSSDGTLLIGTTRGFSLFDLSSDEFTNYFYGNRWHPGERVLGFAGSGGNSTVVLTDRGIAVLYPQLWTLEEKAGHYLEMLGRHTRPPGLVADCGLTDSLPTSCAPHATDNDGLWTSIALAAEAFRYQVTGEESARDNAWSLFQGMQFLNNVTGVRGLMARSVVTENVSVDGGVWHNSSTEPGWKWKGDTSSDEVVGHMFAYPIVHDLVAKSAEEKVQPKELVDNIIGYIHNNSYYLIDVTNQSTTWGVWNPQPLNFNQSWCDEHGLNSLQIVTFLLSAYRLTGREEYLQAWTNLSADNGVFEGLPTHYGLNLVNQKITVPRDDNYSDDELAFLPYFTYFFSSRGAKQGPRTLLEEEMMDYVTLSIKRAWQIVRREKSALWNVIYAYAMYLASDPELTEAVVWNLRTWPLELVEWNTTNSHRLDITFNPEQDRNLRSNTQSERVLPANERTQLRWNRNPFLLDSGGAEAEMDPGAWLLPYWMARWIEML